MSDGTWITIISLAVTFLFMMGTPVLLVIFYWVVGCSFVLDLTLDNTGFRDAERVQGWLCPSGDAALYPDRRPDQQIRDCQTIV